MAVVDNWAPRAALEQLESRCNNAPCILTDTQGPGNDVPLVRADLPPIVPDIELDAYDAGLLGGDDSSPACWWHEYIRSELAAAHDFYQRQVDTQIATFTAADHCPDTTK